MKNVVVTGSEGSLMQAVIPRLVERGFRVIGIDNLSRYGKRLGHAGADYFFEKGDLTDPDFTNAVIRNSNPTYIIQAAATIYGVGGFNRFGAEILSRDPLIHSNVLYAAKNVGAKKVVYISSSMVYENCPQALDTPVHEEMPDNFPAPFTEYGLSKFTGERLSKAFAKQFDLNYTIWRPFNIITPYEKAEGDVGIAHVFADFIKSIVIEKNRVHPRLGDGEQVRCFTWIGDVADGIVNHLEDERTDLATFNLGNRHPVTMNELADMIKDAAIGLGLIDPATTLEFREIGAYPNDVRVRIPDVSRANKVLGWTAKKNLWESITECLSHLKSN